MYHAIDYCYIIANLSVADPELRECMPHNYTLMSQLLARASFIFNDQ